jgi:hypothetical protein
MGADAGGRGDGMQANVVPMALKPCVLGSL